MLSASSHIHKDFAWAQNVLFPPSKSRIDLFPRSGNFALLVSTNDLSFSYTNEISGYRFSSCRDSADTVFQVGKLRGSQRQKWKDYFRCQIDSKLLLATLNELETLENMPVNKNERISETYILSYCLLMDSTRSTKFWNSGVMSRTNFIWHGSSKEGMHSLLEKQKLFH